MIRERNTAIELKYYKTIKLQSYNRGSTVFFSAELLLFLLSCNSMAGCKLHTTQVMQTERGNGSRGKQSLLQC